MIHSAISVGKLANDTGYARFVPLGSQNKRKGQRRAVDMSAKPDVVVTPSIWVPPPPDECEEAPPYTITPPGADQEKHRAKMRGVYEAATDEMVEFAVVQEVRYKGKWRFVASADSCHNDEIHLHRYGRIADGRVGDPEHLMPVERKADVQVGYELAYERIVEMWAENFERWQHA